MTVCQDLYIIKCKVLHSCLNISN